MPADRVEITIGDRVERLNKMADMYVNLGNAVQAVIDSAIYDMHDLDGLPWVIVPMDKFNLLQRTLKRSDALIERGQDVSEIDLLKEGESITIGSTCVSDVLVTDDSEEIVT